MSSLHPRRLALVLSVLAAALLVASVTLGVLLVSRQDERDTLVDARKPLEQSALLAERRSAALAAGRQAILDLDALSVATIDRDLERVLKGATGKFKDQFAKAQADLKGLIVERKTTSVGEILSSGVVEADQDTATVLIAVDRLVKDSTTPEGTTARDRWKLVLELIDGRWLVADLEAVA